MWSRERMECFVKTFEGLYTDRLDRLLSVITNPENNPEELLIHGHTIGSFAVQYKLYLYMKKSIDSISHENHTESCEYSPVQP